MVDLPRLKPDPIPAINPVPEFAVSGARAAVYERTKAGLGVPWMGVVAMAFAHYPRFYDTLWSAMEPITGTKAFEKACRSLRDVAEREAEALEPSPLVSQLSAHRYGAQEIEDIRACNEIFSSGNMPYVLMATLARHLLEGNPWRGGGDLDRTTATRPNVPKPALMEPHHASDDLAALYDDLRAALGLPFVNTDYRAFARWPSYFTMAWNDLSPRLSEAQYANNVERVHHAAVDLAASLPNMTGITPDELRDAATSDASLEEVLSVVRLFQWLLPGLAVNVAFFRSQLQR
ncbi:halocarboxylic acid dehydrogenase DehI family protein [Gymnodinialimonas ceratoperidinii]|uniref:Halocarboxylic acid dehydrogenase DehI family protein n=1 Tax=Gymnodinialimonas ceratoperidinii TaxID=2856823 RepID=A0A8F6YC55_9RHOB|nr:halocarboxylic acid dehydrogenase DehI family protein [Gymnodinialimonas ceratoperidinii]QXT40866.1 halocarboxylic acid dehydrogenase DehI family protein [Gymnodinialimonas ceratoperidinii]